MHSSSPLVKWSRVWARVVYLPAFVIALTVLPGVSTAPGAPAKLPSAAPEDVGVDPGPLAQIDRVVREGIEAGQMPGCVVMIGRRGKTARALRTVLRAFDGPELEITSPSEVDDDPDAAEDDSADADPDAS